VSVTAGGQRQYNFDGDMTDGQVHGSIFYQLLNYWSVGAFAIRFPERADERMTRGGPVVHRSPGTFMSGNIGSDARKALVLTVNGGGFRGEDGAREYNINTSLRFKPAANVSLTVGPSLSGGALTAQFVDRFDDPSADHFHGQRVVFSDLEQRTLSMDTRISATFSPTLTLEVFAQPFISSGDYRPATLRYADLRCAVQRGSRQRLCPGPRRRSEHGEFHVPESRFQLPIAARECRTAVGVPTRLDAVPGLAAAACRASSVWRLQPLARCRRCIRSPAGQHLRDEGELLVRSVIAADPADERGQGQRSMGEQ
jgi:hypothetical protein